MSSKITLGICSDWLNGKGILSCLTNNFDVPWAGVIDGQVLDDDYYGNRSSNKIIAPLVEKFIDEDGISDANMVRLARVIYAKYGNNWQRSYDALMEEYNPIWNVDGTETITVDAGKRKKTFTKGRQQNDETYGLHTETLNKDGATDTITDKAHTDDIVSGARKKTTKSQIEGFNSPDFSDANKEIVDDDTVTDQNKYGLHETENAIGERVNEYGQQINNIVDGQRIDFDEDDAYRDTTTNVRQGNIGVTSTQNLLTQEMEFRLAYSLMDSIVFPDVDKVMCLGIFGCDDLTMDDFTIITNYVLPVASASLLGGVKIGNGITIAADGTISVDTSDYITQEQLTEAIQNFITQDDLNTVLASYVTGTALAETLSGYATTTALATKQDALISGTNIKTINGSNILGSGNVNIQSGNSYKKANSELINGFLVITDQTHGGMRNDGSSISKTLKIDISEYAGKFLKSYSITDKVLGVNRMRVAITNHELEIQDDEYVAETGVYSLQASNPNPSYNPLYMTQMYSAAIYVIGTGYLAATANSVSVNAYIPDDAQYMYIYYYSEGSEYSLDNVLCTLEII